MRVVHINRDMDAAAMAEMKPMFEELADSAEGVCFDLSGVGFLDSSGVGGIVFVFKRLRERSLDVTLTNVEGQPLRLLRQLRLEFMIERRPVAAS
jgi:anti-anti-sigma factor